jgi:hypothetical protein
MPLVLKIILTETQAESAPVLKIHSIQARFERGGCGKMALSAKTRRPR